MSAERSPDVRRSPPKNIFGGRPADPRGTGRSPRVSARIRAEPRRKVFRRANSPKLEIFATGHPVTFSLIPDTCRVSTLFFLWHILQDFLWPFSSFSSFLPASVGLQIAQLQNIISCWSNSILVGYQEEN